MGSVASSRRRHRDVDAGGRIDAVIGGDAHTGGFHPTRSGEQRGWTARQSQSETWATFTIGLTHYSLVTRLLLTAATASTTSLAQQAASVPGSGLIS